ncbi:MAG: hypothetical protein MZV70_29285 [Desulfobacterales bacterium]|nr:hypothetical protein [Desulfobacterales bacterium]
MATVRRYHITMRGDPGILVHGGNHFIVRGPDAGPGRGAALVRRWSVITIGSGVVATEETLLASFDKGVGVGTWLGCRGIRRRAA